MQLSAILLPIVSLTAVVASPIPQNEWFKDLWHLRNPTGVHAAGGWGPAMRNMFKEHHQPRPAQPGTGTRPGVGVGSHRLDRLWGVGIPKKSHNDKPAV